MIRVGLYRPVHVKTLHSQKLRRLLTYRRLLQSKAIAIENDLRGTLRNFGLKVGMVGTVKFEARIEADIVRRAARVRFVPIADHRDRSQAKTPSIIPIARLAG